MISKLVSGILLAVTHLVCLFVMTERKYSMRRTGLIYSGFCVLFVLFVSVCYILFGNSPIYYICGFISTITIAFFVFVFVSSDALCKKIFLFISYANIICVFVCVSVLFCRFFFSHLSETAQYYAQTVMRTLLFVPAAYVYIRYLRPTVRIVSGKQKKTWYSVSIVSFMFLAVFFLLLVTIDSGSAELSRSVALFFVAALIYASVLWVIFGTIQYMLNENKVELINQNVQYLRARLEEAKKNELAAKTVRHDIRHHNRNLAVMLNNGEIREALRYLDQYDKSVEAIRPHDFCPNVTVNAILIAFYTRAQNEGIRVSIEADADEALAVSDMDLVAILSNLLENAINGCKECRSDGEIRVSFRSVMGKTVIVCSNPCKDGILIENNMIKERGIGIAGIVSAAKKYNGDIRYSVENGVITACVILNS